ncbi:MAG: DICT sensory domain-containing protein [Cyanobacteria bacterium P01_A01_bin.83]
MNLTNSLLWDLVTEYGELRPQIYFKSSLTALARAMQDLILTDNEEYLVIANFQQEKYFKSYEGRFEQMAARSKHIYVMGVPAAESSFAVDSSQYETIPLEATDTLAGERYLVIIGQGYSACLAATEKLAVQDMGNLPSVREQGERYEGIWTFDRDIAYSAADWLLGRITNFRPELKEKTEQARKLFVTKRKNRSLSKLANQSIDLGVFTQSLVTYLQAGQYKLIKAYKAIATAERKEVLSNKIAAAQRSSLEPDSILTNTVKELGKAFPQCRCLLYCLNPGDTKVQIKYEAVPDSMASLVGEIWLTADNPLFITAQAQRASLIIDDVTNNAYLNHNSVLKDKISRAGIKSWLMVSIRYQGTLLGMLELHHGVSNDFRWRTEDVALIEAVATSAGAALTQASSYTNLLELNTQLEAVERIQNNLIAIVGHELRTPLTTIRICLESLASEPDMSADIKHMMLDTALSDSDRLEQLIQNFLTLSRLEAGKVYQNIELLTLDYALNLALRQIKTTSKIKQLPEIKVVLPPKPPKVLADIDGLVNVLTKLLDNACKFTPIDGKVTVQTQIVKAIENKEAEEGDNRELLEVIISDTGRGISSELLETIFNRFAQSEGFMRRTVSGTGLGLVICRQIIHEMGGQIWATSDGENKGSQFHFTLPIES